MASIHQRDRYIYHQDQPLVLVENQVWMSIDLTKLSNPEKSIIRSIGKEVTSNVCLVKKRSISRNMRHHLTCSTAIFPTFQKTSKPDNNILIILPRIHVTRDQLWFDHLKHWLDQRPEILVLSRREDRFVLGPKSCVLDDAIRISNDLHEHFRAVQSNLSIIKVHVRKK